MHYDLLEPFDSIEDTDEHYGGYNLLQNRDLNLNVQAKFKRNIKFVICHLFLFPGLFRL